MSEKPFTEIDYDRVVTDGMRLVEEKRARRATIEKASDEQRARLANARIEADEAREFSLLVEPWEAEMSALRAHTRDGRLTAETLNVPNTVATEIFGARLAFDALDCADDDTGDRLTEVLTRYSTMVRGGIDLVPLLAVALDTIVTGVVGELLDEIEQVGGNWETRVSLAEARTSAWRMRLDVARAVWAELSKDEPGGPEESEL
ncbi:hypothetical protein [Mycolicibacterium thermoresistibile]